MDIGELLRGIMMPSVAGTAGPPAAMPAPGPTGTPPAPTPGGPAMVAPGGQGGAPAPAAAAPPDLGSLYQKLLKEERSQKLMDSGMTLLAAGFAQPQNRAALIGQANAGGSGGSNAATQLQTLLSLQKDAAAKLAKEQMRQRLPSLAKQYGLDMDTVNFLFESGKLDETINTLAKPDTTVHKAKDGSTYILNSRNGKKIADIEGPDPLYGKELRSTPGGGTAEIDRIGGGVKPIIADDPNYGKTTDLKELDAVNAERKLAGLPPRTAEDWLSIQANNKAAKTAVTIGDSLEKTAAMKRIDDLTKKSETVETGLSVIERMNSAREVLDRGVMSGSVVADPVKEARKVVAQAFGFSDEIAENTDLFQSQMKELVLPRVKQLGSGSAISNADVKFIEQALGAAGSITPATAREIMLRMERLERNAAKRYNTEVDEFGKIEGAEKAGKFLKKHKLPPPRVKPETVAALKAEIAKGGTAAISAIKQFDEYFGADAAEAVLEQQ